MIEIRGIKVPVSRDNRRLEQVIMKKLHLKTVPHYEIMRRSIDARKKPEIFYIYTVWVSLHNEKQVTGKLHDNNIMLTNRNEYQFPETGNEKMNHRPFVIGSGPAGLFCALLLARKGYRPIIVERGLAVEERVKKVNAFFEGQPLDTECNVQFGEGGAGTFSDGKLNTQVKDKYGRIRFVLNEFVKHGAPEEILYDAKPHVGTDLLLKVVKGIREEIESLGGTFFFDTKAVDIKICDNHISGVKLSHGGQEKWVDLEQVVFAIGHSARDTFTMLYEHSLSMRAKDFAMGVRVEHPVEWINKAMYGDGPASDLLPAAPYKLTHQTKDGRGVFSFCMCPGGYVVNASSENGHIAVNGMSYSGRNGSNSNSAIVVSVKTEDFDGDSPLAGMELQRKLERRIYEEGHGKVVSQRYEDFCHDVPTKTFGLVTPRIKGEYMPGNLRSCLPDFISDAIIEGMQAFDKKIPDFAHGDTVLSGVESRTSSPVRIERDSDFLSNVKGVYPCGEGAGYAGGIMSAAMDGMKVAEAMIRRYRPFET